MKLDKSNFNLIFMCGESDENYEGTLSISYKDKLFSKEIDIYDQAYINEEKRPLNKAEKTLCSQINKIIKKEFDKKGLQLEKWTIYDTGDGNKISGNQKLIIEYKFDESFNHIEFSLLENKAICKKSLYLSRKLSNRLLRELK
jgi:hypothetical protein